MVSIKQPQPPLSQSLTWGATVAAAVVVTLTAPTPAPIPSASLGQIQEPVRERFQQVSRRDVRYSCGVNTGGLVICWGNDNAGQSAPPTGTFQQVSAGREHTCGVKTNGDLICWGNNTNNLGALTGQAIAPDGKCQQVSAGLYHTCGIRTDGLVVCWAMMRSGKLRRRREPFSRLAPAIGTPVE